MPCFSDVSIALAPLPTLPSPSFFSSPTCHHRRPPRRTQPAIPNGEYPSHREDKHCSLFCTKSAPEAVSSLDPQRRRHTHIIPRGHPTTLFRTINNKNDTLSATSIPGFPSTNAPILTSAIGEIIPSHRIRLATTPTKSRRVSHPITSSLLVRRMPLVLRLIPPHPHRWLALPRVRTHSPSPRRRSIRVLRGFDACESFC